MGASSLFSLAETFRSSVEEHPADAEPKFNPFTGSGRRLDGKPLKYKPAPASSSGSKDKKPAVTNGNAQPSTGSNSQATSCQAQGKLVFGSNASRSPKETKKEAAKETKKEKQPEVKEDPKF